METSGKRLSDCVADEILSMVAEQRFQAGDKLPNENELSAELGVSRATLREAVRTLAASGVLEIRRGVGTFVAAETGQIDGADMFGKLSDAQIGARDLYEIRLIFEPQAAYLAAQRASDTELARILSYGREVERLIESGGDRTRAEQSFHKAIAKATHNAFISRLMPILYEGIGKGVVLSKQNEQAVKDTLADHRLIMEFLSQRNPEGARDAMRIHILHAVQELNMN